MEHLRGSSVLVTGGSGFIGSCLTARLVAEGADVHVVARTAASACPSRLAGLRDQISLHQADVTDGEDLAAIVARVRPAQVLHLAARAHVGTSWTQVDEHVQTNVQGTVTLLRALAGQGFERFVHVSTSDVYGPILAPFREDAPVNPMSPYAVSKYAAECYCRMFHQSEGWPIVVVRPFPTYGPAQSPDRVIPELIVRALRSEDIALTLGLQIREFNHVDDVVDGIIRAATTAGIEGEVLNLGCGEEVSIRAVVAMVLELTGSTIQTRFGALPERPGELPGSSPTAPGPRTARVVAAGVAS
ncbi:MAG: SDR family NAD(P)-dependent oxidoreductase [Acidimicrobiales bacterium]